MIDFGSLLLWLRRVKKARARTIWEIVEPLSQTPRLTVHLLLPEVRACLTLPLKSHQHSVREQIQQYALLKGSLS